MCLLSGSLIKHQLVTHLTLGIALRAVLDALRKPVDSKVRFFPGYQLSVIILNLNVTFAL